MKQVAVAQKADADVAKGRILAMHAQSVEQTLATRDVHALSLSALQAKHKVSLADVDAAHDAALGCLMWQRKTIAEHRVRQLRRGHPITELQ